ncbi:hypothetical protein AB0L33_25090 [Streptomyces sp. NPDC052299]|uniref:hypothetical protein n=1 Tax=Streptomyces sp. NPDC052299 TaxID=3155054 RepID=UPI0034174D6B
MPRRTAAIAAATTAFALGAIGPAQAANTTLSTSWGSMTHIDSGDHFKVCDTRVDGFAVTGGVQEYWPLQGTWHEASPWILVDGGDAGCSGEGDFNVEEGAKYRLKLCLANHDGEPGCVYKVFYE